MLSPSGTDGSRLRRPGSHWLEALARRCRLGLRLEPEGQLVDPAGDSLCDRADVPFEEERVEIEIECILELLVDLPADQVTGELSLRGLGEWSEDGVDAIYALLKCRFTP